MVIDTANNTANIYYARNSYDWTINHVEQGNEENVLAEADTGSAPFGSTVALSGYVKTDIAGYTHVTSDPDIVINTANNTATIYYAKNGHTLTVKHQFIGAGGTTRTYSESPLAYNYGDDIAGVSSVDVAAYRNGIYEGYGYTGVTVNGMADDGYTEGEGAVDFAKTMPDGDIVVTFTYTAQTLNVTINKVDEKGAALTGAKFTVNSAKFTKGSSTIGFPAEYGAKYTVTETAPAGYDGVDSFTLTIGLDGAAEIDETAGVTLEQAEDGSVTITVVNQPNGEVVTENVYYAVEYYLDGTKLDIPASPVSKRAGSSVGYADIMEGVTANKPSGARYEKALGLSAIPDASTEEEPHIVSVYYVTADAVPEGALTIRHEYYTKSGGSYTLDDDTAADSLTDDELAALAKDGKLELSGFRRETSPYKYVSYEMTAERNPESGDSAELKALQKELADLTEQRDLTAAEASALAEKIADLTALADGIDKLAADEARNAGDKALLELIRTNLPDDPTAPGITDEEKLTDLLGCVSETGDILAKYDALADLGEQLKAVDSLDKVADFKAIAQGALDAKDDADSNVITDEADRAALTAMAAYELPSDGEAGTVPTAEESFEAAIDEALKTEGADAGRLNEWKDEAGLDMDALSARIAADEDAAKQLAVEIGQQRTDLGVAADTTAEALRDETGAETEPAEGTLRAQYNAKLAEKDALQLKADAKNEEIASYTEGKAPADLGGLSIEYSENYNYTIVIRYEYEHRVIVPDDDDDEDPRPRPKPQPDDDVKVVPKEEPVTVTIPEGNVPLANTPNTNLYTIVDGDVPLGNLPASGGKSAMFGLLGILSLLGAFLLGKKKKDGDEQ